MKDLLGLLQREQAEELRLASDSLPMIGTRGKLHTLDMAVVTLDELGALLASISTDAQRQELQKCGDLRFVYVHNSTQFAITVTQTRGTLDVTIKNLDL